ncbi:oligosaccharide flippase family protein [Patescibacteria group bacterium]|nr:oligosaccharide flippase family protein [Patescibacteria group bacterium]
MSTRKIATSTFWQLGSQVTMAALSILTVKFVAVGLSKELAGNYNSAYGFLQLFGILADFGLYAVAVREVSRSDRKEEVLGALIILRSLMLVLSLSVALFFVWFMPMWKGTPLPLSVTIASLVPFFTLLAGIIRTVFQINYKMHFIFIAEVAQRIFTVIFIGLFILLGVRGSHDLHILHLLLFIGGVGAFLLFFLSLTYGNRLMRIRPHWDTDLLKQLAKSAAPFGFAFLCMALYRQFDVTLIALLRPDFELQNAYYGFVIRMADMGFLIPTFLLNSTLPILSERDAKGEDTRSLLGKTLLIILILGSISLLFSVLWSRPLIQLLTTDSYLSTAARPGSDTALRLLGLPMFLNGIVMFGFYVLLTKLKWKRLVAILLVGVLISLSMNIWLIPIYGFVGAASTSIVVHVLLAIALLIEGARTMPFTISMKNYLQWAAFSLFLAAGLWIVTPFLTNELATVIALVCSILFMGILVWITGLKRSLL